MKAIRLIMGMAFLALTACYEEDKLTPSEEGENVYNGEYTLPQGNHDYDNDILELFSKYQTMFLYKYEPHDIYYNYNTDAYLGGSYDAEKDSTYSGMFDIPSDEAWVGKQLDLLKELWLGYYPDDFLLKRLPQKVYMVDSLFSAADGRGTPLQNLRTNLLVWSGGDYMLVTYGDERVQAMTREEKFEYKIELNLEFLMGLGLPVTAAFSGVSNYTIFSNINNQQYIYQYGFLNWNNSTTPQDDWLSYLELAVSVPYEELIVEGPNGFLHPSKDSRGLISQKYELIVEHFLSEYQIDLKKIGRDFAEEN